MRADGHLVIGIGARGKARIRRVTQGRPTLEADEAVVRVSLELPDDLFVEPVVVVPVSKEQAAVAVEVEDQVP